MFSTRSYSEISAVLITCVGSVLQECSQEQSLPSSSATLISLLSCPSLPWLLLPEFKLLMSLACVVLYVEVYYVYPRLTMAISASHNGGACHIIPHSFLHFWKLVQRERRGGLPSLHQLCSGAGWVPGSVSSRPDPSLFSFYCLAFSLSLFLFIFSLKLNLLG